MTTEITNKYNNATMNGQIPFDAEYDALLVEAGMVQSAIIKCDRQISDIRAAKSVPTITRRQLLNLREMERAISAERHGYIERRKAISDALANIETKYE